VSSPFFKGGAAIAVGELELGIGGGVSKENEHMQPPRPSATPPRD